MNAMWLFFSVELRYQTRNCKLPSGQNATCNLFDQIYLIKDNNFQFLPLTVFREVKNQSAGFFDAF